MVALLAQAASAAMPDLTRSLANVSIRSWHTKDIPRQIMSGFYRTEPRLRDYNDFRAMLGLAFLGGLALLVLGYYMVQLVAWVV